MQVNLMKNHIDKIFMTFIVLSLGVILLSVIVEIVGIRAGNFENQGRSWHGTAFYGAVLMLLTSAWFLIRRRDQKLSSKPTWKSFFVRGIASFALAGGVLIVGFVGGLAIFGNDSVSFIQVYFVPLIIVLTLAAFPIVHRFMK